ncbi:hypothetical protein OV203_35875 [Nannocystis sp. ILAH1]|uniref:hypothetical protein n=1 Tax=unclassified Nannocystis TaxID=2627009 RepID=UPI00227209F3|nr:MULTISPECIES: hypothetical protein [unclassified Nannocystis]MCY0992574.1 hypothetical protein [Nannocystis sp. ILAH1]MCY1070200.1 hypothetical protein [Nannocystis sp. RBIL2]
MLGCPSDGGDTASSETDAASTTSDVTGTGDATGTSSAATNDAPTSAGSTSDAPTSGASESGDGSTAASTDDSTTTTGAVPSEPFSFFVTSLKAMQELSGSQQGFGGDLRFGEEGPGAGLRGADKICAAIAEMSMPGAGSKPWRAFLSASADENGEQVDAIDRVGDGPWYDRLGRLVAADKDDLLAERPVGADSAIQDDLPNEDGVPNHQPDPLQDPVDNHDTLTGSGTDGRLESASSTCLDWTSAAGESDVDGKPMLGHSWPRGGGGGGPGPGPGPGDMDGTHWIQSHSASGCAPGVNIVEMGPSPPGANTVGAGGGYGGIYCFSRVP